VAQHPPGYIRGDDGVLATNPTEAPVVAEAFRLRAEGATVKEVRAYLASNGVERSWHGVQAMLKSRVPLGEIHFGALANLAAHEPIVNTAVWQRAQRTEIRGPKAKSDRLLARQDILRCGSCGGRMSVGTQTQNGRKYGFYRCSPLGDCKNRMAISAEMAEKVVADYVRAQLADVEGKASAETHVRDAEQELDQAQSALEAGIRTLADFSDEPAARERLSELRRERDEAQQRLEKLGGASVAVTINASADWEQLTLEERRALIRATIASATVRSGRGAERITITPA
jgi:hypothetical protein